MEKPAHPGRRAGQNRMVHQIRFLHHERLGHNPSKGEADDMRPSVGGRLPNDIGQPSRRVPHREGAHLAAPTVLRKVGGQGVELGQTLELRKPHTAAERRTVQKEQQRLASAAGLIDVKTGRGRRPNVIRHGVAPPTSSRHRMGRRLPCEPTGPLECDPAALEPIAAVAPARTAPAHGRSARPSG